MSKKISQCYLIIAYCLLLTTKSIISSNNVCTFRTQGKLFSLTYLQTPSPYILQNQDYTIYFNFCFPFAGPPQCIHEPSAFAFVVYNETTIDPITGQQTSQTKLVCESYTSNSTISMFYTKYEYSDQQQQPILQIVYLTQDPPPIPKPMDVKQTQIIIQCSNRTDFYIDDFQVNFQESRLIIEGNSMYGCPVFQISSIWRILQNNLIIFGIFMVIIGFYLMFYGRSTIDITVFLAATFIALALLGSILTLFVSPNSSTIVIYTSFLLLLFLSCMLGYAATKLITVSIFFIGAFLGFIIGILVSSIFVDLFNIQSQWPLILFVLLFSIPLGLLTFKYSDDVIIASSAFTGAYLVVRPFSWIIGGFPNEFLIYSHIQAGQIHQIGWGFFLYLIVIIILAIVGSMYQRLKLHRQNPSQQIQVNIIQQSIEAPIDAVKVHVDKLIQKFRTEQPKPVNQDYQKMSQLK